MRFLKLAALSSLTLLGITTAAPAVEKPQRILACNMNALTKEQRARHEAAMPTRMRSKLPKLSA